MKSAVFFDVDDTLLKGQTQEILARYLYRKGEMPFHLFLEISSWFLLYKSHLIRNVFTIRRKIFSSLAGWELTKFNSLMKECFEKEIKPKIFSQGIALIQEHRKRGHEIILTSASLSNAIDLLKEFLELSHAVSTKLEVQGNKLTGKISGLITYGKNKIEMIRQILKEHNISLEGSYAYTDHISDLPLLELVDNPVVVNPDRKLKKIARQRNWKIYNFREER